MKEKLELKHLAPYLPYRLSIGYFFDGVMICKSPMVSSMIGNSFAKEIPINTILQNDGSCKPILRPLSDVEKEIEHNGERFVPIKWFESNINKSINIYLPINKDMDLEIDIETEDYSQTIDLFDGYISVQKLLEWHFDVFGLIDKGLAIDINTLEK